MFSWLKSHWKGVATLLVAAVVFTAVTVLTGGLGAPLLVSLAAGGFASGAAGYVTGELLNGRKPTVKDALFQGALASVITVGTFGVGRFLAPYASRVLAPVVNRIPAVVRNAIPAVVTRTVANSAVGAAFGTGTKVAANAITGRPLTEGTGDAAIFGAMSGALAEPSQRLGNALRARVFAPPRVIDPVTQSTMDHYGMTRDTLLYRVTEPQWVQNGQIAGNPKSMALVRDPYNLIPHPFMKQAPELNLAPVPRQVNAASLGPSLNVALKDPGIYGQPGQVKIAIRLGDVLDAGGKIYPDSGALAQGLRPLIVTFDGKIPVASMVPAGNPGAVTQTSDTTAVTLAPAVSKPSKTRGLMNALGGGKAE